MKCLRIIINLNFLNLFKMNNFLRTGEKTGISQEKIFKVREIANPTWSKVYYIFHAFNFQYWPISWCTDERKPESPEFWMHKIQISSLDGLFDVAKFIFCDNLIAIFCISNFLSGQLNFCYMQLLSTKISRQTMSGFPYFLN